MFIISLYPTSALTDTQTVELAHSDTSTLYVKKKKICASEATETTSSKPERPYLKDEIKLYL